MGRALPKPAHTIKPTSRVAAHRTSGSPPSPPLPLLTWETERDRILIEARRTELRRRIARLIPRSHARIVLEAELRSLTLQALRASMPS